MEKKETLEEVAKKLTKDFPHYSVRDRISDSDIKRWFLEALQKGAKWQQEQDKNKYSEEDMHNLMDEYQDWLVNSESVVLTFKNWFEKFKKK